MKKIQINTNSWHYKFLQWSGNPAIHDCKDLCQYIGAFAVSTFVVSLVSAIAYGVLWLLGDFLAWLVAGIIYGFVEPNGETIFVLLILAVGVITGLIFSLCEGAKKAAIGITGTELGKAVFTSIKDKVCFQIEFR